MDQCVVIIIVINMHVVTLIESPSMIWNIESSIPMILLERKNFPSGVPLMEETKETEKDCKKLPTIELVQNAIVKIKDGMFLNVCQEIEAGTILHLDHKSKKEEDEIDSTKDLKNEIK